jgi:hypothetical protein
MNITSQNNDNYIFLLENEDLINKFNYYEEIFKLKKKEIFYHSRTDDMTSITFAKYFLENLLPILFKYYEQLQNNETMWNNFNDTIINADLPFGSSDMIEYDITIIINNFFQYYFRHQNLQDISDDDLIKKELINKYRNISYLVVSLFSNNKIFDYYKEQYNGNNERRDIYTFNVLNDNCTSNKIKINAIIKGEYYSNNNLINDYLTKNGTVEKTFYDNFRYWYANLIIKVGLFDDNLIELFMQNNDNNNIKKLFEIPHAINTTVLKFVLKLYNLCDIGVKNYKIICGGNIIKELSIIYNSQSIKGKYSVCITDKLF